MAKSFRPPPTEQRNPRTRGLDLKSTEEVLRTLNREDARVARAVAQQIPAMTRAVSRIVAGIWRGGRLFYLGAATSGRLGVMDAAECPPTFRVSQDVVQGIVAGGVKALARAGNDLRVALVTLKTGIDADEARRQLAKAGGNLRRALGETARRTRRHRRARRENDGHG